MNNLKNLEKIYEKEIDQELRSRFGQDSFIRKPLPIHVETRHGLYIHKHTCYDRLLVEGDYVDDIIFKGIGFLRTIEPYDIIELKCTENPKVRWNRFTEPQLTIAELALHPDSIFTHHVCFVDIINDQVSKMTIKQLDMIQIQKIRDRRPRIQYYVTNDFLCDIGLLK